MADMRWLFFAFIAALSATVLVAIFVPGESRDPEITRALTYAVVAIVGAMGGAARGREGK